MTNEKKDNETNPQPPSSMSGIWIAALMIGLVALIVAIDMLRSKP